MRDPKRVKVILNQLAALWASSPDLRLGQLILNAAKAEKLSYDKWNDIYSEKSQPQYVSDQFSDIYNVEDEELIQRICKYLKKC